MRYHRQARLQFSLRWIPYMIALALIAACQGPPPTEYVIITSTPTFSPAVTVIVVTATPSTDLPTSTPEVSPTPQTEAQSTEESIAAVDGMPTPTFSRIQVAEQPFENGRMFWLEPIDQIWVMVESETDKRSGVWMVFPDDFEEGDPELDPTYVPPSEELMQPVRGFGKLWRDNDEVRAALGWARQPEIGHVSSYQYLPAGEMMDGAFVAAPGQHLLTSGFGDRTYRFNEINGTWQTLRRDE